MTSLLTTLGSLRAHLEDSDFDTDVDVITSRGETLDSQSPMQWPRDSSADSGTSMWYEEDDDYETLVEYEKPPPLPTSAPPTLPKPQPARRPDSLWSPTTGLPPPPPLPVRHSTSSSHRVPGAPASSPHHYGSYPSKFTAPPTHRAAPPRPQRGPASSQAPPRAAMSPGPSRSAVSPGAGSRHHAERHRGPSGFPGPQDSMPGSQRGGSSGFYAPQSACSAASLQTPTPQQAAQSPQYPDVFDSPVMARRVSSEMANAFFPAPEDLQHSSPVPKFARAPSTPDTPMVTSSSNSGGALLQESPFSPCPEDTSSRRPSKTFAPCTPRLPLSASLASSSSPAMDSPSSTCSSRPGSLTPDSALPSPQGEAGVGPRAAAAALQRCDKCGKWRNKRRGPVARQAERARGEVTPRRQGGAIRSASASDLVQKMGGGRMDHSSCSTSSMTTLNDCDVSNERRHCPPPLRRGISADAGVMARLIEQAKLDEPVPAGNDHQEHRRLSGGSSHCPGVHHRDEQVRRGSSSQDMRSDQVRGEMPTRGKVQGTSQNSHYRQGLNRQPCSSKEAEVHRHKHPVAGGNHGPTRQKVDSVSAEQCYSTSNDQKAGRLYHSSTQHVKTPREAQSGNRLYQKSAAAQRRISSDESTSSAAHGERQRISSGKASDRSEQKRNWRGSNKDLREEKSHYRSSDFLKQLNIPTDLPPLSSVSKFGGSSKDLRGSTSSLALGKDDLNTSAAGEDLFTPRRLHKGLRSRSSKDLRELSHGSIFGGSGDGEDNFGLSRSREDVSRSRMSRCGGSSKDLTQLGRDNMEALDSSFFGEPSTNLPRLSRMGGSSKDITALYTGSLLGGSTNDLSSKSSDSKQHHRESSVLSSVSKFGGSSWELSRTAETERTKRYKANASSVGDKLDDVGLDASGGSTTDLSKSSRYKRQPRQSSSSILDSVFGGSAKDLCERRKRLGLSCENLNDASTFGVTSSNASRGAKSSIGDSSDAVHLAGNRRGEFGGSDPNLLESSMGSAGREPSTQPKRGDNPDYKSVTFLIGGVRPSEAARGDRRGRDAVSIQRVSVSVPRAERDQSGSRGQVRGEDSRGGRPHATSRQAPDNPTAARDRGRDQAPSSSRQDGFYRDITSLPPGSRSSIFGSQWDLLQLSHSAGASTRMGGSSKDIREVHQVSQSSRQSASMWDVRELSQGATDGRDVFRISDLSTARGHVTNHVIDPAPADANPPVKKKIIFEILV